MLAVKGTGYGGQMLRFERWAAAAAGFLLVLIGALAILLVLLDTHDALPPLPEVSPSPEASESPTLVDFAVGADGVLSPEPDERAAHVWSQFERVATSEYARRHIAQLSVGDRAFGEFAGAVQQTSTADDRWTLIIDGSVSESRLISTLIHEYAHLITLDHTQVTRVPEECSTLETEQWMCTHPGAYLNDFWDEFWAPYGDAQRLDSTDPDVGAILYAEYPDDFVTPYAATNAVEDIAESFTAYVLADEIPDPSDGVVAAKTAFFDAYPAFVEARERIRADFGDDLPAPAPLGY